MKGETWLLLNVWHIEMLLKKFKPNLGGVGVGYDSPIITQKWQKL